MPRNTQTSLSMQIGDLTNSTEDQPVSYRQVAPGVAEIKFEVGGVMPLDACIAIAMGSFGHGAFF